MQKKIIIGGLILILLVLICRNISIRSQNKYDLLTNPPTLTIPAVIISNVGNESIVPLILYQIDGTVIRVPYGFSEWIIFSDDSVKLGTLPISAQVMEIKLWVSDLFNAQGTVTVGHKADKDAYLIGTSVATVGVKTNNHVADGVQCGKSEEVARVAYAYYNPKTGGASTGKALVSLTWKAVDPKP